MRFVPDEPFSTRSPRVVVDAGLPPGRYRFKLVVVGSSGRESHPMIAVVTVLPPVRPLPIPVPDPIPRPLPGPIPLPGPRFPP